MAFQTARKIAEQVSSNPSSKFQFEIYISINGVDHPVESADLQLTTVSQIESLLGADGNIANGFVTGLISRPDYFWLLSANEEITSNSIYNLIKLFEDFPEADLLVANAAGRLGGLEIENVFYNLPSNLALGLISGVIYNFNTCKNSFHQATLFAWTGWGQLAVIQNYLANSDHRNIYEFPDSYLYETPYTYSHDLQAKSEREIVRDQYTHSFFGFPLIAFCLLQAEPKKLRRFQLVWLARNWYKIAFFLKASNIGDEAILHRITWVRQLSRSSFKSSILNYCIFSASSCIPVTRLQNSIVANKFLQFYKRRM
jgi:hypothetical protein